MSRHPPVKWAQNSDKVFITIELPDTKDVKFTLQPDEHLHFSAVIGADSVSYEIDFYLYNKVNVDEIKAYVNSNNICYTVKKAKVKWWSRMLRQEGRPHAFVVPDWDKWIDEEDEESKNDVEPENSDEVRKKCRDMFVGFMDGMRLLMHDPANDTEGESTDEGEDDEIGEDKTEEDLYAAEKSGAPAGLKKTDIPDRPNYRYKAFGFLQALSLMMNAPTNANAVDEESADEDVDEAEDNKQFSGLLWNQLGLGKKNTSSLLLFSEKNKRTKSKAGQPLSSTEQRNLPAIEDNFPSSRRQKKMACERHVRR